MPPDPARPCSSGASQAPPASGSDGPARFGVLAIQLVAIVSLTVAAAAYTLYQRGEREAARIEAVAELHAAQVAAWQQERLARARFLGASTDLLSLLSKWQREKDAQSLEALITRLSVLATGVGAQGAALLDDQAQVLVSAATGMVQATPALRALVAAAITSGDVAQGALAGDPAGSVPILADFVAPLVASGKPARAVVLLRVDASATLLAAVRKWPVPSTSGATLLVRRDGDMLVGLRGTDPRPLSSPDLLAAMAIRGDKPFGKAYLGRDFGGASVLGAVVPIERTAMYVIVKIDSAEIFLGALRELLAILISGLLAAVLAVVVHRYSRQRVALAQADRDREAQDERLRSLALVGAIAENATDAIFVKDRQGRYLLFNREAGRAIGRRCEEVVGHDDHAIFGAAAAAHVIDNDREVMREDRAQTYEETLQIAGETVVFLATKGPLHNDVGAVIGLFGIARNITASRRTEQALRDSEATMRALLGSLVDGVFLAQDHRFVFANPALPAMLGYSPETFVGLPFAAVVAPEYLDAWVTRFDRRIGGGPPPPSHYEVRFLSALEPRGIWVELRASRHEFEGRPAVLGIVRDVSERRRAEQAVRDSESQYRSIFSALTEGVAIFDTQGRLGARNPAAERLLGLSAGQLLGLAESSAEAQLPIREDGSVVRAHELPLAVTLATGQALRGMELGYPVELGYPDLPGRRLWLRVNSEPVLDPISGALTEVVLSFSDVTARHAAEQQLRKLSLAVEQNPSSIVITDIDGRIEYVNKAYVRTTGFTREEVLGRKPSLLKSGLTAPAVYDTLWETLKRGVPWKGEFVNRRKSGEEYSVFTLVSPIRQADGRITHYLAIQEDITERKRIGAELDRHRHRLEDLVEERTRELQRAVVERTQAEQFTLTIANNVPGLVAYWDRSLHCRFATRAVLEWFGKPVDQVINSALLDLVGEKVVRKTRADVDKVLAGHTVQHERAVLRPDGKRIPSWLSYVPDRHQGEVRGFFFLQTDITEIKKAENRLQQLNAELTLARDRAQAANRAKSAFLANMSHEIRTPMNAIVGLTHLLRRESRDAVQADRLDKVSEAADHLLRLLNDILDLSKIESGKLTLEQTDFSIEDLLLRASDLVGERARSKGLELIIESGPMPAIVRGDSTRLLQALLNLLGNAVKFTRSGWIRIRSELIEDSASGLQIRLEVQDTGVGIEPDHLTKLFHDFEQADSTTTRRFGGTGLGLAITRRLVEFMGGQVGVNSEPESGSTFWFTVRLGHADFSPTQRLPASLIQGRVLVVDDQPPAAQALVAMLSELGLRADAAPAVTPARALWQAALAAGDPYRLVLIDWPMADDPAWADIFEAAASPEGGSNCTIMCALDEPGARLAALRLGAQEVVRKPLTRAALHDLLVLRLSQRLLPGLPGDAAGIAESVLRERFPDARVLLAEDNLINQIVAVELLRAVGLRVEVADNGRQALERMRAEPFDLVLMDIQMPEMDGLAATRAIRELPNGRAVPIIAMTANAFGEDRMACLEAGMNDHIGKPVDPAALFEVMLRWLSR